MICLSIVYLPRDPGLILNLVGTGYGSGVDKGSMCSKANRYAKGGKYYSNKPNLRILPQDPAEY